MQYHDIYNYCYFQVVRLSWILRKILTDHNTDFYTFFPITMHAVLVNSSRWHLPKLTRENFTWWNRSCPSICKKNFTLNIAIYNYSISFLTALYFVSSSVGLQARVGSYKVPLWEDRAWSTRSWLEENISTDHVRLQASGMWVQVVGTPGNSWEQNTKGD